MGYKSDWLFSKVLEKPGDHKQFVVEKGLIWTKNRGGETMLCITTAKSGDKSLHGLVLEQAYEVVGHFGPQHTSDYV